MDREVLEQCYEYSTPLSLHRYVGNTPAKKTSAMTSAQVRSHEPQHGEADSRNPSCFDLVQGHKRSPKQLWLSFE